MPRRADAQPQGLGARIRERRESAGLTQAGLARAVDADSGHIARIERGAIRSPNLELLHRIATTLHTSIGALLGETETVTVIDAIATNKDLDAEQRRVLIRIVREMTRKR